MGLLMGIFTKNICWNHSNKIFSYPSLTPQHCIHSFLWMHSKFNFPFTKFYSCLTWLCLMMMGSHGSSVSIVFDYGLDEDRAIGVWSPAEAMDFPSSLWVQTGSGAHPASYLMVIKGPFPGVKHGRGVTLTTHSQLVPKPRMSRSSTFWGVIGWLIYNPRLVAISTRDVIEFSLTSYIIFNF
jgi:hypothetical protein